MKGKRRMNDSYIELMVKRDKGVKEMLIRAACVLLILIMVFVFLFMSPMVGFILIVAAGVLTYFGFQRTDVEFEYLYLDKEITIDKVYSKAKRKRVAVLEVDKLEILAPQGSHQLDSYSNRQVKTIDASAGHDINGQKLYAAYYDGGNKYLMNLDEKFIKAVKFIAPRKVYED